MTIDMQLAALLAAPKRVPDEAFVAWTYTLVRFDGARTAALKAALARVGLEAMASGAVVLAFVCAPRIGEASEKFGLFSPSMVGTPVVIADTPPVDLGAKAMAKALWFAKRGRV